MKSPFAIFRKHQKVLMVVLTALAMFAFVVLDSLTQNMAAFPPIFGVMLGLGIAWALTRKQAHSWAWLLVGGIAGGFLGAQLQATNAASRAVVTTSFGAVSEQELQDTIRRQQIVNAFLTEAFRAAHDGQENPPFFTLQQSLFGGRSDPRQEALMHLLLTREAKKLNLAISRSQITAHIDRATSDLLTGNAFGKIVNQLGTSANEIYELIGEQMMAQEARAILMPELLPSPEDYWTAYQKLNVTQELAVVPVSVESFQAAVGKPTEDQLKALFEEFKDKFPGEAGAGKPGFRQPGRIQLGYLEFDYDTVEKSVPAVTDAEIAAYYEANKDEFRNNVTPQFPGTPGLPGFPDLPGFDLEGTEVPSQPAPSGPALMAPQTSPAADEATSPAATETPATPAPATPAPSTPVPATETPATETPAPAADGKPQEKAEPPAASPPASDAPEKTEATDSPAPPKTEETPGTPVPAAEPQSLREHKLPFGNSFANIPVTQGQVDPPTGQTQTPTEAPPAGDQPETPATEEAQPATPPAKPADPADAPSEGAPAKEAADKPKPESTPVEPPAPADAPAEKPVQPPLPEFKPLDDAVKAQIAKQLLAERTRLRLSEMTREAMGYMVTSSAAYAVAIDAKKPEAAKQIQAAAQKFAAEHPGVRYVETPFLSPEELENSEDHPIGRSTEPVDNPFERANARSILEQLFAVEDIEALRRQRFRSQESEDPTTLNRFVHWQIDFRDSFVPTLSDEGIEAQVTKAWTELQAQEAALKRAEEIAELLRKSDKPWGEALEGISETGKEGSPTLVVSYTGPFNWLTRSSAPQTNPFAPPPMELTQIPIIFGGVTNEFMERVFLELGNGEIGTVWGGDRRYVYVARVDNRTDTTQLQTDFLGPQANLFSFISPYARLAGAEAQQLVNRWTEQLYERYEVKWKEDK